MDNRILHAVDTLSQLGFLALQVHYILNPPARPLIVEVSRLVGAREILLIIYSAALLCQSWTSYAVPCAMVFSSFLFSLPSVPFPGDGAFTILLVALPLHVLLLHLPRPPSPNFLFSPSVFLPLSTLLWHEFTRTLYPILLFYLPAFLVSSFLLSQALADSIPQFFVIQTLIAAPMEIRGAFVVMWAVIVLLIVSSTVLLVLFSASLLSSPQRPSSAWDRYSQPIGLQARRTYLTTVTIFSEPYYFPAPFNLLQLVFLQLPGVLLRLTGDQELLILRPVQAALWRCTVGLITFIPGTCLRF